MIIPAVSFFTQSLREHPRGPAIARVLAAALDAVDPSNLIKRKLHREGNILHFADNLLDLEAYQRIFLVGIGKAAIPMTITAVDILERQVTGAYLLTKKAHQPVPDDYQDIITLFTGGHPLPDRSGLDATQTILSQISDLKENDLVIILLSGGGSALFTLPSSDLRLEDLIITNQLLQGCGANINEINIIRKHLSAVKGGNLAQIIHPASSLTLILSDVIGDQVDSIASGPTVADRSTFKDALEIIHKFNLQLDLSSRVYGHLERGSRGLVPETLKNGDPFLKDHVSLVIGSNQNACQAGARQAEAEGFHCSVLPDPLMGEASKAGLELSRILRELVDSGDPLPPPACLITGGETTVNLSGTTHPGLGGRNLELALSAAIELDGLRNCFLITLATDGEDGVTDAAGAVVTGESLSRAREQGLDPAEYLKAHDSYSFFRALDDLLLTGPSGTNVNDLCFLFTYE